MKNISSILWGIAIAVGILGCSDTALAQTVTPSQSVINFCAASTQLIQSQTIQISVSTTSTTPISFTAMASSNPAWLGVGPGQNFMVSSGSPVTLTAFVTATPPSATTGTITLTPSGGTPVNITATYQINTSCPATGGGSGFLTASPTSLAFQLASGVATGQQSVTVNNTSTSAMNITATTKKGSSWLSVGVVNPLIAGSSSTTVTATVNTTGLNASQNYSDDILVTGSDGVSSVDVPVSLSFNSTNANSVFSVTPGALAVSTSFGTPPGQQNITVQNLTAFTLNLTAVASTMSGGNWLSTSIASPTVGPNSSVIVAATLNTASLALGTYTGTITITDTTSTSSLPIPVTLYYGTSVGTSSELSATPNPFTMTIASGTTVPQNGTLNVSTTSAGSVSVVVSTVTTSGQNWLAVNPASISVTPGQTTALTVSVTPSLLQSGLNTGRIVLTPQDGTPVLQIPVNITLGAAPTLTITPSGSLSFAYQTGTTFPAAQVLTVSSASAIGFTASASSTGNWLIVSPQSGATSGNGVGTAVNVSVNPAVLSTTGNYSGTITVTNSSTGSQQMIQVSLLVSSLPVLSFANSGTTFNYQLASTTLPTQKSVQLMSSSSALAFTAAITPVSGGNFLNVTPASGTTSQASPQPLSLSLNSGVLAQLAPGTYTSNVVITSTGAGNSPVTYPVTLVVTNNTLLNPDQTSLTFNYEIGQTQPAPQTINISSSGAPLSFNVATSVTSTAPACANFLSATPPSANTPGIVIVSVNTTGLAAGSCAGNVNITSANAGNSPLNIPVTLNVSNSALLNVSPSSITVTTQQGTNAANIAVPLTSTDPNTALSFVVTTAPNSNFLLIGPTSGMTPTNLNVGFSTSGLQPGTYTSSLNIAATGPSNAVVADSPVTLPITVIVTSAVTASVTPNKLSFSQAFGGAAPNSQTLQIATTTSGLTYSAAATTFNGGSWLTVMNPSGTTTGTVTINANGTNLNTGTYSGVVTITIPAAGNNPINVPVTLTIGPAITLSAGPSSLTFNYQSGGSAPAAQNVMLSSTGGSVSYTTTTSTPTGTPNFLSVSPGNGTTPATLSVSLNQSVLSTLSAGNYTGTVTILSPNLPNQTVSVSLTVTAPPAPSISTVVNAASILAGSVSPGEFIAIKGADLGPATAVPGQVSQNKFTTTLSGVSVTFDGTPAPLIAVSATQVNAMVPYEIAGRTTTNVVVTYNTVASPAVQLTVANTAPAIFTANSTGSGQALIQNFPSYSLNNSSNPAPKGSFIVIYATGEGVVTPAAASGSITPSVPPIPVPSAQPITLTIGGQTPSTIAATEVPTLVSGVFVVVANVPSSVTSGNQPLVLTVGGNSNAQQNATVAIQ